MKILAEVMVDFLNAAVAAAFVLALTHDQKLAWAVYMVVMFTRNSSV